VKRIVLRCNNFWNNFCVKAAIIGDRKLIRIELIRINLRSLRSSILASFHARNYLKNFCNGALAPILCFFLLLSSCSPNSSKEFQKEGETHCRSLVLELQKIENREQLLSVESKLKKQFNHLIDLMIEAREFQQKRFEEEIYDEPVFEANSFEDELEKQLRRIYAIEGGREVIERTQQEALVRLDAYERTLAKKREAPSGPLRK
jgi:hypothetical protein